MQANRLEERVANLERKVRINRGIQAAVGLGALLYLTSSLSAPTQDSARPRRLELVDSEGRTRIVVEADPAPRLVMLSPSGQEQVLLGIGG